MKLVIKSTDGNPVTSSLIVAENTDNDHASVIRLTREYQQQLEELGTLRFEIRKSGGRPTEYAMYNEEQATFLLTLMRNSEKVVQFKLALVKAFFEMRDLQKTRPVAAPDLPAKLFPSFFRVARLIGCDKNAAAISANQAVVKLTGTSVLSLLGSEHLEAENQQSLFFTPTELGERMGISGRKFNLLLAEAGLQAKKGEHWVPMAAAEGFCRIMDTGKRHGDGTMIQQVKWAETVTELFDKTPS